MVEESVFDFLKEDNQFAPVYSQCKEMEYLIIHNFLDSAIVKARFIGEILLRIIIRNEFPSLNDQLILEYMNRRHTHSELINKVYDERLISYEIKNKYDQIRIMGNNAAFLNQEFNINDIGKIHKIIFQLSLDCFERYNKDKIEGVAYIPILNNDDKV